MKNIEKSNWWYIQGGWFLTLLINHLPTPLAWYSPPKRGRLSFKRRRELVILVFLLRRQSPVGRNLEHGRFSSDKYQKGNS